MRVLPASLVVAALAFFGAASSQIVKGGAAQEWWQHAVIYEVYPRSFQDSNGDGVGDLRGITQRLNYLEKLGVDAIWIAPIFPSPQVDFGYDISDYEAVDPQYGTLADFDHLLAEAAKRKIHVILDMVLNHTSDQDAWFAESAGSRTNAKEDWYLWNSGIAVDTSGITEFQKRNEHDGKVPPNNWESLFGGSAWEWVPARRQFYYHFFFKQQPDLNWRNPAVENAMFNVMKFWLDRGVAGFRLDAITTLFEDPQLRSEPETSGTNDQGDPNIDHSYTNNLSGVHDVIRRMRTMVSRYPGQRVLIGETYLANTSELDQWYGGQAHDELQLPMDMLIGFGGKGKLDASTFRKVLSEVETQVHGSQPLLVFDNHDNVRSIDRFGDGAHDVKIAKIIATLLYATRATALTYYGAEIGMRTTTPTRREDVKDPIGISGWPKEKGRDGERTPMQWTPGPQAGFSKSPRTWLPIPTDFKTVNVETEEGAAGSLLNWSKALIALRRTNRALRDGSMMMLNQEDRYVLSFVRRSLPGRAAVIVAVNMSAQPQTVVLDLRGAGLEGRTWHTLLASDPSLQSATSPASITLPPYASWVAAVNGVVNTYAGNE